MLMIFTLSSRPPEKGQTSQVSSRFASSQESPGPPETQTDFGVLFKLAHVVCLFAFAVRKSTQFNFHGQIIVDVVVVVFVVVVVVVGLCLARQTNQSQFKTCAFIAPLYMAPLVGLLPVRYLSPVVVVVRLPDGGKERKSKQKKANISPEMLIHLTKLAAGLQFVPHRGS